MYRLSLYISVIINNLLYYLISLKKNIKKDIKINSFKKCFLIKDLMNFHNSKEKHLYHTFSAILFSLIPLFLVTGPFLADLSISLINILFLVYCLKKKNFSYFKNKYFHIFIFLFLSSIKFLN